MKVLISRNNINDYTFDTETSVAYVHALKILHSEDTDVDDLSEYHKSILRKAGLYSDGKLRVFNYKKPKKEGYTISPQVKRMFNLWALEELSAQTWFKNKTFVESMELLISKYGVEAIQKAVHILVPIGNQHEYIKTIRNPQQLLNNYGKPYVERFKSEDLFTKNTEFINRRKQELQQWNQSSNHIQ